MYIEIQNGPVAISYLRKCANISSYMRRPLVIYDMTLQLLHSSFLIYEENLIFFYISVLLDRARWFGTTGSEVGNSTLLT
jgi:hypothetical protein